MEFTELRRKLILKEFSRMNDVQKRAVFGINGATLILAGAGSGKTTNTTLVKGGYVGIENGKLKQYKPRGKNKLLCICLCHQVQ